MLISILPPSIVDRGLLIRVGKMVNLYLIRNPNINFIKPWNLDRIAGVIEYVGKCPPIEPFFLIALTSLALLRVITLPN